ncbi:shikimate dehydrogenase family protein [Ferruginibacter albus]|uniref:shikimate dehydrogenase family protein n=1 Tax=Ferruginibacter albus TaxID=2875540 RepID=UPI001CC69809|nr:shikimate dehydrogenase [Ferruginibacter albus]UAY52589.1 shikimate dehydrogenase [Ferruginibacter albus]
MKLYGLIGYPLGHSFSKEYFTKKFERENLTDCSFEAFPIPTIEEFPALIKNNPSLKGLSVTIPYKEQVLQYITELSDEVKFIGATNSIKISGDKLIGYNTDIIGFEQSFSRHLKPHHKKALILGTGGAAKAVQYVLQKLNIEFLTVTRNAELKHGFINYSSINEVIGKEYTVIINCSPVGTFPNADVCPDIPYSLLTSDHYLFDLVYNPAKTLFLQKGEEKGTAIQNGYDMLVLQAEASWKIWNS